MQNLLPFVIPRKPEALEVESETQFCIVLDSDQDVAAYAEGSGIQ